MNSRIIHLAAVALTLGLLTSACDRQPRKTAELQRINDSMEHPHNYADTFNADRQKWEAYKLEARERLQHNEDSLKVMSERLTRMKDKMHASYEQRMTTLRSRNEELRNRIEGYKEDGRENWMRFETGFNSDMDSISRDIKGLFAPDQK